VITPPHIRGGRLIVQDRPRLLLGGELRNSSGSTRRYLEQRWARIVDAGCTTVLAPVAWEQLEPEEGQFDTTSVDDLLQGARSRGLSLVLLWFGSWKNGVSSYVPPWVKGNAERFPVQRLGGNPSAVLSPFAIANADADGAAFAHLMAHLRLHDTDHTVLMMQVENEVGCLGDARDRSPEAQEAWESAVPASLLAILRDSRQEHIVPQRIRPDPSVGAEPTWAEAFGGNEHAEELFMAWHYATYIERVARTGRAEHDIPLFVNAWLNSGGLGGLAAISGGERPGSYPSGGPLPHVAVAWHAAAPSIDFLAPDIYAPDPEAWLSRYRAVTPAVFVPELRRGIEGVETIYLAVGEHGAIGISPFGIDDLDDAEQADLRLVYDQLGAIADDILEAQDAGTIRGFVVRPDTPVTLQFGRYRLSMYADFSNDTGENSANGCGLVLAIGDEDFVLAGSGVMLRAVMADGGPTVLHTVQELDVEPKTGRARNQPILRWLNGDETMSGYFVRITGSAGSSQPSAIPPSRSVTGLVRFSLLPMAGGAEES
jgi:hypothetical protein